MSTKKKTLPPLKGESSKCPQASEEEDLGGNRFAGQRNKTGSKKESSGGDNSQVNQQDGSKTIASNATTNATTKGVDFKFVFEK